MQKKKINLLCEFFMTNSKFIIIELINFVHSMIWTLVNNSTLLFFHPLFHYNLPLADPEGDNPGAPLSHCKK